MLGILARQYYHKYACCCFCIQVNADVVEYVRLSTGDFVKFSGSTDSIGQNISTKAVGSDERRDITHQYKYPEGAVAPKNNVSIKLYTYSPMVNNPEMCMCVWIKDTHTHSHAA